MGGRGASFGHYATATERTQSEHQEAVRRLAAKDSSGRDIYEDGTYNVSSLRAVSYDGGYQVTFCQIGDNHSKEEYRDLCNEFLRKSSDGVVSAGKFEGEPEISFNVSSRSEAIRLAKKYNQISIWDWKNLEEIKTGGTGRRG